MSNIYSNSINNNKAIDSSSKINKKKIIKKKKLKISKKILFSSIPVFILVFGLVVSLKAVREATDIRNQAAEKKEKDAPTFKSVDGPAYAPGEVLVKFKQGTAKIQASKGAKAKDINKTSYAYQDYQEKTLPNALK